MVRMTTLPTPLGIDTGRVLLGTIFPNADIGTDPEAIRDYARAVEDAGPGSPARRTCTTAPSTSRSCSLRIWPR